jgi:putative ABC transport system permease protein
MAVRSALGAGRWRLLRQMLVESLLVAGLGGALGVLGAAGALRLLRHTDMIASMMLPAGFFRLDLRVLGFALAISVLGIPLVSLLPCLWCSGIDLARMLASSGRSVLGSRGANAAHLTLVGTEVALTIILLVAAGLMVRSFANVVTADPGLNPENVWTMGLYLPDGSRQQQLLEQLQAIPGVENAALAYPPLRGWGYFFCVQGHEAAWGDQAPLAEQKTVSPGYFETMGIPLLQGRLFDERDRTGAPPVVIVDETLAQRYWPAGEPVGQRIQFGKSPNPNSAWLEIVGVVKHIKYQGIEAESRMQMYRPLLQKDHPNASILLRTKGDPAAFLAPVRSVVRPFDSRLYGVRTLDQMLGGPSLMRRLTTLLLAVFAGIALFLSTIGIYAVMRYSTSRRTQEFGVRVALGATRKDVLVLVLRKGLTPVLAGAVLGLVGTVATARALSSLLFQLSPWDPVTYTLVCLLLIGVALVACYLPARRAARIDPMVALRYE